MINSNPILILIIGLSIITASKYILYVLTSPFYSLNKAKFLSKSKRFTREEIQKAIKISVIIPAWNEEIGVVETIKSVLLNQYNNLQVVAVDDGSSDNTFCAIDEFNKTQASSYLTAGKSLLYFSKPNGGKGSALNYGIQHSDGDIIITMDADTVFEKDALFSVAKFFIDERVDAAVGNVKVANSKSIIGIIQQIEYTIGFYFKRVHSVFNSEYIIGGAFGAFRRDIFERYGYFDENNKTEDIELSTRLQTMGCRIVFIEDAVAYTEGPVTFKDLAKQRLRWKKGRLDTFIKHRELFFSRKKYHSKFLTHYLLPITLFYEIELVIEPFLTIFGIYYLYTTHDFSALIIWILFTGVINTLAFVFGSSKNNRIAYVFLPIYFLLSYVLTIIEIYAMYMSIKLLISKKDVTWQKWSRKGIGTIAGINN
jgi:cellulose synthase/poly-beta-1,6-N-acetylglucosamine synthase-like glycosyltransferase